MTEGHFNPNRAPYLNADERIRELKPYELLKEKTGIKPGMTCIDLGSGTGAFSFPMLSYVGSEGVVYAVDDSDEMLQTIRAKNPPSNLIFVHSDVSQTGLDSGIADLCVLSSILHEVPQPPALLAEAFRLLKPGGRILVIDWKADLDSPGPPQRLRLSKEKLEELFGQIYFQNFEYFDWSRNYYIVLADK
jgi:ubiquinone/menaquinone biosynthesis C-methylase UbiE